MGVKFGLSQYRRTSVEGLQEQGTDTSELPWEEVTAELHNKKLHNLYYSLIIIRVFKVKRMKWPGSVTHMVNRNLCTVLVGKTEGNNPHGRPR
jgi:hypothetical protein